MPQYVSLCREAEKSIPLVGVRISINIQANEGDTGTLGVLWSYSMVQNAWIS